MSFRIFLRGFVFLGDFRSFLYRPAYLLYFQVLKFFGPTASSSVTYSVPMFGTLWGVLFFRRSYYMANSIGCAVILSEHCNFSGERSMKIVLIRHGQTDWNKKKIQGHTNTALDSDGHRESIAISEALDKDCIELIFSSPLKRAYSTIEPLARRKQKAIICSKI